MNPVLGFAGMTHLGLVSGVCASEKGFGVVCFDQSRKIVNRPEEVCAFRWVGSDISGNAVIAARGGNCVLETSALGRASHQDRGSRAALPRPDVAQEPLGELPDQKKREPQNSGGRHHRQNEVREKTSGDSSISIRCIISMAASMLFCSIDIPVRSKTPDLPQSRC